MRHVGPPSRLAATSPFTVTPQRQRQPSSHPFYLMADSLRPRLQSFAGSVLSHRVFLYSFASTLAVSATVINALQNQSNFYSVAVYLSKSGASVMVNSYYVYLSAISFFYILQVLANFGLLLALMCGRLVQQIFFGSLRPVEVEVGLFMFPNVPSLTPPARDFMTACGSSLPSRFWRLPSSETNSTSRLQLCLAFSCLSNRFIGSWQTASNGYRHFSRIAPLCIYSLQMNQMPYPGPTTLFHIRISGLFFTLWLTNVVMLAFAAESILSNGVGVIILFASEVSKTNLLRVSHYHRAPSVFDSHGQLDEFKIQVYPFCHRIPSRGIPRGRECATMGGQEHVDFLRRFDYRCVPPSNSFGSFLT